MTESYGDEETIDQVYLCPQDYGDWARDISIVTARYRMHIFKLKVAKDKVNTMAGSFIMKIEEASDMFQAAVDGIIHEIEPDEQSSQLNKVVGKILQKRKRCISKYGVCNQI